MPPSPDSETADKRMNNPIAPATEVISKPTPRLLDTIRAIRASVGDGLNDDELTRLLRQTVLPSEAGLVFLSFSGGLVTLAVPEQDPENWYSEKGWIAADKERIARAIAAKYGLSLCIPPDQSSRFLTPRSDSPTTRHHLELSNRWETVVVAHPSYLKVRMFGAPSSSRYLSDAKEPLLLGPELLQDLSALYPA
jgi:hypothetical protein